MVVAEEKRLEEQKKQRETAASATKEAPAS